MAQPGLSSFTVPKAMHGCTPVAVKATPGLRLLPELQSAGILNVVEGRMRSYPFQSQEKDGVVIMDGKDEGVYAWITANWGPSRLPRRLIHRRITGYSSGMDRELWVLFL